MTSARFCYIDLRRALRKAFATTAALSVGLSPVLAGSNGPTYCRDYKPSMSLLSISLPAKLVDPVEDQFSSMRADPNLDEVVKLNLPPAPLFTEAAIRYALTVNFVQQMTISALADESPFLATLQVIPVDKAIRDAMGFGAAGTRLREPGAEGNNFEPFNIEYVEEDEPFIQSDDSKTVFISRGVVKNIVKTSLKHTFGSVQNYERFMKRLLGTDSNPGNATDLRKFLDYRADYLNAEVFPLGEVIESAAREGESNMLWPLSQYSELIVGQFLFIGAHEIGHDRLGHRAKAGAADCAAFRTHEEQADEFAATALADFNFGMAPAQSGEGRLTDFEPFFLGYKDAGFTNEDLASSCTYDDAETRRVKVVAAYGRAIDALGAVTFGGADYTTANPTGVWCSDGRRVWLQEFE
jgi:hypothetical protein